MLKDSRIDPLLIWNSMNDDCINSRVITQLLLHNHRLKIPEVRNKICFFNYVVDELNLCKTLLQFMNLDIMVTVLSFTGTIFTPEEVYRYDDKSLWARYYIM